MHAVLWHVKGRVRCSMTSMEGKHTTGAWHHAAHGSLPEVVYQKALSVCCPVLLHCAPDRPGMAWHASHGGLAAWSLPLTLLGGKAERSIGMGLQSTV